MKHRRLCIVAALVATLFLAQAQVTTSPALATGKAVQTWTAPRADDGHPDLQGFWTNNNATPLERPKELEGRTSLTDEEVAALRKKAAELFAGSSDAAFGDTLFQTVFANVKGTKSGFKSTDGETGDYSSVWNDTRVWDNRTSLITDPPDGKLPEMTPEGQKRRDAIRASMTHPPAGPQDRALQERCITYGSPQLVAGYQSYYQIVQTARSVVIMTEMIHDARSIPLDAGPHLPSTVHQWFGDSRGHWEGDTLVVDSTNYKSRSFMSISSEKLHIVERFSRSGPDTIKYEIRADDPDTWTKPWSLMIPLHRSPEPVYEYACHEGNRGMVGILAGARAEEQAAASQNQSPK
jgi:hypothetical protein